jgi:hypothetical protein
MWTRLDANRHGRRVMCRCDCGTERLVVEADLIAGRSKGCGCTRYANATKARIAVCTTHGLATTREYRIWTDMRRRCHQPHRPDFYKHGGRGISVCDRWRNSFEAFFADMGPCPPKHTLDRLNNDGPYEPGNCAWRTHSQQLRNTRVNRHITVFGETMTVADAADRYAVRYDRLLDRLNRGWSPEDAITKPPRSRSV